MRGVVLCTVALFLGSLGVHAEDIIVEPDPFHNIQDAIDQANDYDRILLADGIFTGARNYDISFEGKRITICSLNADPSICIIDCQGQGSGFRFENGETNEAILRNITIRNATSGGGH